jgi:hypothetical protein
MAHGFSERRDVLTALSATASRDSVGWTDYTRKNGDPVVFRQG